MTTEAPAADRRRRKALRTREALASAAFELVLDHGLAAVTVERIAERADVARRTFSRHFGSKESAALDVIRADGARINALLRARPADEPPFAAYRAAVLSWLADTTEPPWPHRPRMPELLRLTLREPALHAAFHHIRVEAQRESARIVAARLGLDPHHDPRPAVLAGAAAGALSAAQELWIAGSEEVGADAGSDLTALVERAFSVLALRPGALPRQRAEDGADRGTGRTGRTSSTDTEGAAGT
ncbi:TetR/AcrR family transcriptional regulator [Streptomyces johnsoniae]|uniref:TetR family transcriptional regulator n=1 Tax=Streptomyces johnsoniae TaxID=3075532 RepID=A0ABU2RWR0_9ACTN|nr:TetR family transcriptional regulator [Streptomyces sp. DSM 41886]MDT0441160.1 TetR family transcriptional regulator [Streptomyces sp. DSM 41886]